ncbi:MAG: sensor histidine kinase [Bacillota bacterium]
MRRSWSLPIRVWLAVAMVAVVLAPLVSWLGTIIAVRGPLKNQETPWQRQSDEALGAAVALITSRPGDWGSADFQRELQPLLERGGYSAGLLDSEGRVLFASGSVSDRQVMHGDTMLELGLGGAGDIAYAGLVRGPDGQPAGQFLLVRSGTDPLYFQMVLAAVSAVLLALGLLVWWVGRSLNLPLKALGEAAHQVNRGELEFALPASRVRELNELAAAFAAMRDGLRESLTRQAELEQERRLFVAAVAHDLRTPLSSVRGYLEGLRDGVARTPEQVRRYVAVALEKAVALERLVDSFFAYARTEYLEQPPQREELELGELLRASAEALGPGAGGKGVALRLDGPPEPCPIRADRQMLGRVIDNLLENAIRHTPEGGTVTLGWRREGDRARFWVQDTGPGIPPEDLGRVFQPLYRGDRARSTRTGGAGLGLAIARRLVEAHGGSIAVENRTGARFTVTLPVTTPEGDRS